MKFTKNDIKPVIVLGVIFLVAAVLIAGINVFTAPEVAKREQQAINDSLSAVMPGGNFENVQPILNSLVQALPQFIKTQLQRVATLLLSPQQRAIPVTPFFLLLLSLMAK